MCTPRGLFSQTTYFAYPTKIPRKGATIEDEMVEIPPTFNWDLVVGGLPPGREKSERNRRRCANEHLEGFDKDQKGCFSARHVGVIPVASFKIALPEHQEGYLETNSRCRERQWQYHILDRTERTTHEGRLLFVSRRSVALYDVPPIPDSFMQAESDISTTYDMERHMTLLGMENWLLDMDRKMTMPRILACIYLDLAKKVTLLEGASGMALMSCTNPGHGADRATWTASLDYPLSPERNLCLESTVGEWCMVRLVKGRRKLGKLLVSRHDSGTVTLMEGDGCELKHREMLLAMRGQPVELDFQATLVAFKLKVTGTIDALSALKDYFVGGGLQTAPRGLPLVSDDHLERLAKGEGYYNGLLNCDQRRAVYEILEHARPHTIYLLVGPPGTGKTATLDEVVVQVARHHQERSGLDALVFFVVPTNVAVRSTTERLVRAGLDEDMIVRLLSEQDYLRRNDALSGMSQRATRMMYRSTTSVVVGTPISVARICMSLGERNRPPLMLLLDEAGYMPASDAFAAMTCNGEAVQTVAAGDRLQLRPRSSSKIAELLDGQYSLFDMLADSDYFQDDGIVPKVGLGVSLTVNYRAHPRLVRGVSALFYHGLMTPARDLIVGGETLRLRHELREVGLDVDANPLYWVDHTSRMERDFLTSSLYNVGEAEVVVRLVEFLTSVIPHRLITVLSPYRKQVLLLREMLPPTVPTYTVDEIIGQERPVVIVSLVRSDLSDTGLQSHGLGFLREPNRVNVMVSRAKELAILVGSRAHFAKSRVSFWETLTTRATGIQPDF